jgi:uncharacterized protein (TIGR02246 family)
MKLKPSVLFLLFALAAPLAQADQESPAYQAVAVQPTETKDIEIAGLFDRWNNALQTGNAQTVTDLYAPNAVLQPTVSNQIRITPAQIKDYFEHFLLIKPVGKIDQREIRQLGDHAAMDSGVYTFTLTKKDGKTEQVQARYTFVYEKIAGEWKILNHHSSAMPEAQVKLAEK